MPELAEVRSYFNVIQRSEICDNIYIGSNRHYFDKYVKVLLPHYEYIEPYHLDEGADILRSFKGKSLMVYSEYLASSVMMVASYLIKYHKKTWKEAYKYLRSKRCEIYLNREQQRSLRDYGERA